ncbi:hypothetical protein PUN28_015327 [Cardiocondyla obscurior]|uniref:Uncharacterized protein n=1 Tax=Cardiocondyla obscurior TaxID=286306 RepID=A0AAW2ESJ5_9HYME
MRCYGDVTRSKFKRFIDRVHVKMHDFFSASTDILDNGGRKRDGGMEGRGGKGEEVWAREEVKVTSRRGDCIAKVASTGAPLTFKSSVLLAPATVSFRNF